MIEKRYSLWKCNDYKNGVKDNSENAYYLDEEVVDLLNSLIDETKKLEKENLDLSEELDYYKAKCASLETGLFQAERETEQLRKENKELQGKASSWKITASEQIMEQSKLIKENEQLKAQLYCDDEEGVCSICKHHYLEKTNIFYISKCEKGHEECSTDALKHCKDFEIKELQE